MKHKSLQFRVGALVCGTLTVFVGLVLFIVGSAFDSVTAHYYIRFDENVKGMVIGSKVNFQGVPIGAVSDIRFRDGQTSVEISVDPRRAVIQEVTRARLDRLLVTGQVTVELEGYEKGAKELHDGAVIQPKDDPLHALKSSLPEVVTRIESTLANVDRLVIAGNQLLGPENRATVGRILENIEGATAGLPERVDAILARLDAAVAEVPALTKDARDTLRRIGDAADAGTELLQREDVGRILASAQIAIDRLTEVETGLARMTDEATALVAEVRSPLHATILTARESLRELRGLARQLRNAPSSLLFGGEQEEIEVPARPGGGAR